MTDHVLITGEFTCCTCTTNLWVLV